MIQYRIPLALAALSLALASCGGGAPKSAGSAPPPAAEVKSYQWLGREKVGKAIALLNAGEAQAARRLLAEVLRKQPSDAIAASLARQIDTAPEQMLGTENFAYTAREGDSYSSLAARYLGNPTLFYALARYNGVSAAGTLAKGTALRIPGHEKREAAVAPKPEPRKPAAPRPVAAAAPAPSAPASNPPRAALLRAAALEQMNRGAIVRAVYLLGQARQLDPANPLIQRDLDRAIRIRRTVGK